MTKQIRKNHRMQGSPRRQSGVALVIGLLLLLVLTILAISGMTTATVELQMAGNQQYEERAFQAAEAGVEQAMATGVFTTGTTAIVGSYDDLTSSDPKPIRGEGLPIENCDAQGDGDAGQCEYFLRYDQAAGATPVPGGGYSLGSGLQAYHFVVDSVGVAERGAQSEHTQSFYIVGPGGS